MAEDKPTIYNAPTIYKTGAEGGGGGGGGYTPDYGEITIYGKKYRIIKMPDGKTWLADNLDAEIPGILVTTTAQNVAAANYKDEAYREKYGLLYNGYAVNYIRDNIIFPDGFRLPTDDDFVQLKNSIGPDPLFSYTNIDSGWPVTGLRDSLGFSIKPTGQLNENNTWEAVGSAITINTTSFSGQHRKVWVGNLSSFYSSTTNTNIISRAYAIRLVKD